MSQDEINLGLLLILWGVAAAPLFIRWKHENPGVGLPLAFAINLWLIHWPGAAIQLLSAHPTRDPQYALMGFTQGTLAILAFVIGSRLLAPIFMKRVFREDAGPSGDAHPKLPLIYLLIGVASYLVLQTAFSQLPSAAAAASVGRQLFLAGLCLACWHAWRSGHRPRLLLLSLSALILPFVTMLAQGFIGFGTVALIMVFCFLTTFLKPRWIGVVVAAVLAYPGISLYVSYMRDRDAIREVVWGGEGVANRVSRAYETLATIEWFDPGDEAHLSRIDQRLNQNSLISAAVERLSDTGEYAEGATFLEASMAVIPRALWPGKPVVAGSAGLVAQYTGIQFAEGTSVGIGTVMEFYVNFGTLGVVVGFALLGFLLAFINEAAGLRLVRGDFQGFALWFVTGTAFLNVGGSLVEVVGTAGASLVVVTVLNKVVLRRYQRAPAAAAEGATRNVDDAISVAR